MLRKNLLNYTISGMLKEEKLMRTIKGYKEVFAFIMELRKKRIYFESGKGKMPIEDYWSEIPLKDQTFEKLYSVLNENLKEKGINIILPEDSTSDRLKEQLVIFTIPFENFKNTLNIMVQDKKYLESIKEELGRIIYLVGLLTFNDQDEEALVLMSKAHECDIYTAVIKNRMEVEYAYGSTIKLIAQIMELFQEEFDNSKINLSIYDAFIVSNSAKEFIETEAYQKMFSLNPKRTELLISLMTFGNDISYIIN